MRKPDDCSLTERQLNKVREEARKALNDADALGRFPTPVADIMAAAKLVEPQEPVLNDDYLSSLRHKAGSALRRALGKVLGLFDARERLVLIDRTMAAVRQTFVRLHEAAHGLLRWQRDLYAVVEDSDQSLDPFTAELFDREANAFASEVLFQLDTFTTEAESHPFGLKVPMRLAKKYGSSVYAAVRRYVDRSSRTCAVLVLDPPVFLDGLGFSANLRRVLTSPSFLKVFGALAWPDAFTPDDRIGRLIPMVRPMSGPRRIAIRDRNGDRRECVAEVFKNQYEVLVLIHDARSGLGHSGLPTKVA